MPYSSVKVSINWERNSQGCVTQCLPCINGIVVRLRHQLFAILTIRVVTGVAPG